MVAYYGRTVPSMIMKRMIVQSAFHVEPNLQRENSFKHHAFLFLERPQL